MSESSVDRLDALLLRPTESLAVELKSWIDPKGADGIAKIVKSVFALRNRGGGFLVIGFDDKTGAPDPYSLNFPVEVTFHADAVQSIVSRYASQPFGVEVQLRERNGQLHPVIAVPSGVRVPVVVKCDLIGDGGKKLLTVGDIYYRTLRANNVPSSARINPADFPELMEICFNNREGDIGGFLRRQFSQIDGVALGKVLSSISNSHALPSVRSGHERVSEIVREGRRLFARSVSEGALSPAEHRIIHLLTLEVGLVLDPERTNAIPTREFMQIITSANPQYTGRPVWSAARGISDERSGAVVKDEAWQAFIVEVAGAWVPQFEFMRLNPKGKFYLRRAMQDDMTEKVEPGTSLDVFLMLLRVTEVLAVGLSFAKALGWSEGNLAYFAFEWSNLKRRELKSWANPSMFWSASGRSSSDKAASVVSVEVGTPASALAPTVLTAVRPLFSVFDGYDPPLADVEEAVRRLTSRHL